MAEESLEDDALRFIEDVLQHILAVYPTCEDNVLDDLLDAAERAISCFALAVDDVSGTPLWTSFREVVRLMILDKESRAVRKGRPVIQITKDQLEFLVEQGFSIADVSRMFNCSRKTVERRIHEYGLSNHIFSEMEDSELDKMVGDIVTLFPKCGEKTVNGRLRSYGIRVQRERIRESLRRIDPSGVRSRCRNVLHRRVYKVFSSNALWHIDGYHKLIRWRFVIHGGIDGYSRLMMYLKASTNNSANTALNAFLSATEEYGLPSRVRMDRGGENVKIAQFMLDHPERGPHRHSAITGRSIHNQRIERFWRDLFTGCISFFYYFFYSLEEAHIIDVNDLHDIYALHFVFLPIIQDHLDMFRAGWANHRLRTEGNKTPQQLWTIGFQNAAEENDAAMTGLNIDWHLYGVDWEGPVPVDEESTVVVEENPDILTSMQKQELRDLLSQIDENRFSREEMLSQLAIAKTFVNMST